MHHMTETCLKYRVNDIQQQGFYDISTCPGFNIDDAVCVLWLNWGYSLAYLSNEVWELVNYKSMQCLCCVRS